MEAFVFTSNWQVGCNGGGTRVSRLLGSFACEYPLLREARWWAFYGGGTRVSRLLGSFACEYPQFWEARWPHFQEQKQKKLIPNQHGRWGGRGGGGGARIGEWACPRSSEDDRSQRTSFPPPWCAGASLRSLCPWAVALALVASERRPLQRGPGPVGVRTRADGGRGFPWIFLDFLGFSCISLNFLGFSSTLDDPRRP